MEKRLNWGLLSTARINQNLSKPLTVSKQTRLLAVASRNQSTADAYARQWQIPRAYGSYQNLIHDPEIDVIYKFFAEQYARRLDDQSAMGRQACVM